MSKTFDVRRTRSVGARVATKSRTTKQTSVETKSAASKSSSAANRKATSTAVKNARIAASKQPAAKAPAARSTKGKRRTPASTPVFIRHYCQGLGDCHLLRFAKDDGSPWYMLIDCGLHSSVAANSSTMDEVVQNIATITTSIDVLVITHEHWDHVSGFLTAAEHFTALTIGEVWVAWTENPADQQAREFDTFKVQALKTLKGASLRLHGMDSPDAGTVVLRDGLQALMGFQFGAKGEKVRGARDAGVALATEGVIYLEPGNAPITVDDLSNVRIYVLGPPRDTAYFRIRDRASEMYEAAAAGSPFVAALNGALQASDDSYAPFDRNLGLSLADALATNEIADDSEAALRTLVRDRYVGTAAEPSWRRIDGDWLGVSADLAMQLDDRTNNSSLVLAFEFIDSGRVMLFAADAQVGNWLSWQDLKWEVDGATVTGPELLARVVYYKVGHHGSQNATLKTKGLQLMKDPDLSAFIPTNEADARKVKWEAMPFRGIMDDLAQRAPDRVIRADDPGLVTGELDARFRKSSGSLASVRSGNNGLWVDVEVA
jgi:beta-lactamase superfamily II metal-dependent hydrolase